MNNSCDRPPGQIPSPCKQREETQYLTLLRVLNWTDSRRLGFTENRFKWDFTAAETQGPDKQISIAPITLSNHLRIKPPKKDKELRNLWFVCRVLDFYSSLTLPGRPEEKKIFSPTCELQAMVEWKVLLILPLGLASKPCAAASGVKLPFLTRRLQAIKLWVDGRQLFVEVLQAGFD